MTKEEFEKYLVSIGGLVRTYREYKGPIVDSGFFQYSEGWYDMTKNLIDELIELGWSKRINQAKEKFGGLRFYIENTTPEINAVVNKYESLSYSICEHCGNDGVLRKGGWIRTLCDEHSEGKEPMMQN
jgi:hypothetical protein